MKTRIQIAINADGTPVCPKCNKSMHWESDWSADEVLDVEEEGLAPETILGLWSCPECDTMYYIFTDGEEVLGIDANLI